MKVQLIKIERHLTQVKIKYGTKNDMKQYLKRNGSKTP